MTKAPAAPELQQTSDEELMDRYRDEGRESDFSVLLQRYEREMYRYLARYLGDATLADDVFQNTFLQVHLKRGLYESGRPFRPWLYAIATHQAVDALRKAGRQSALSLDMPTGSDDAQPSALVDLLVSSAPGPLNDLQDVERREWVRRAVDRLPDPLRQTLVLAYFQDLKYREIADVLNIPVGTVKSRLHAALKKLEDMAGASQFEDDPT
jgi:RNA polymerase sigma-70 factor (ECF subfamily)